MKVLVTGATGFVGNYVVRYLLNNNHEVLATSRNQNKAIETDWFNNVQYFPFDISATIEESTNLYQYFNTPDVLIHLAWDGLPNFLDPIHIDTNLFSHYNFLKNYVGNGGKQIVCIGTCLEYGDKNGCLTEVLVPEPNCAYAVAKDSLRRFLEELQKKQPFIFQWVRLFYMYGEGQNNKSIIPQLDAAIINGETSFNMSGGEQLRDYLPVEQVAENICRIAIQQKIIGIINCSSGKSISVRKLIENYISEKKYAIQLNLGYYSYPNYEPMAFWGDNSKFLKLIHND